ncbi:hypothetical protein NDU88_002826 [Pleurodeles waltl]|uniref:Uncharacterized protein n=1 Tax=Pleurodeles waltl TaxID=8319 RepID=A0AAV7KT87_PLEWA|nr:hypothetical protein NDU88_002826 [Pleurodeles waltl]
MDSFTGGIMEVFIGGIIEDFIGGIVVEFMEEFIMELCIYVLLFCTYYSSNKSKGSPLAHGRSDQIRLSDLIGCPIQRYGAADVSCGDGAVIRRLSGDQRIDPR